MYIFEGSFRITAGSKLKAVSVFLYSVAVGTSWAHPPPSNDSHAASQCRFLTTLTPPLSLVFGTFIFGPFSLSSRIFPDFSSSSYSLYIKLLMVALVFRSELAYLGWNLCSNIGVLFQISSYVSSAIQYVASASVKELI